MTGESKEPVPTVWDEPTYKIIAGAALGLLAVGTVVYHYLESWSAPSPPMRSPPAD